MFSETLGLKCTTLLLLFGGVAIGYVRSPLCGEDGFGGKSSSLLALSKGELHCATLSKGELQWTTKSFNIIFCPAEGFTLQSHVNPISSRALRIC